MLASELSGVAAVVLTYKRPQLASEVVRGLIEEERFPADHVLVVVNGEGGLDDAGLASRVRLLELPVNLGPAGGFRHGLEEAARIFDTDWFYLCEDDVGLFDLPTPRVADLLERLSAWEASDEGSGAAVGGVVAYGRELDRRTGRTALHQPSRPDGFEDVDVAAWGASLVSRRVVERGVLPDEAWFFAYEDHDFWLRVREAGLRVLLDVASASAVMSRVGTAGREAAFEGRRPVEHREPWRAYYEARNFFEMSRRHGRRAWLGWHLVRSARRFQVAGSAAARRALLAGLADGARGRLGKEPRYQRATGEL
jgi:GT2 family glycosyltransferase